MSDFYATIEIEEVPFGSLDEREENLVNLLRRCDQESDEEPLCLQSINIAQIAVTTDTSPIYIAKLGHPTPSNSRAASNAAVAVGDNPFTDAQQSMLQKLLNDALAARDVQLLELTEKVVKQNITIEQINKTNAILLKHHNHYYYSLAAECVWAYLRGNDGVGRAYTDLAFDSSHDDDLNEVSYIYSLTGTDLQDKLNYLMISRHFHVHFLGGKLHSAAVEAQCDLQTLYTNQQGLYQLPDDLKCVQYALTLYLRAAGTGNWNFAALNSFCKKFDSLFFVLQLRLTRRAPKVQVATR